MRRAHEFFGLIALFSLCVWFLGRFDATPGRFDATPGRFDATPGRFDATPGRFDATPGEEVLRLNFRLPLSSACIHSHDSLQGFLTHFSCLCFHSRSCDLQVVLMLRLAVLMLLRDASMPLQVTHTFQLPACVLESTLIASFISLLKCT